MKRRFWFAIVSATALMGAPMLAHAQASSPAPANPALQPVKPYIRPPQDQVTTEAFERFNSDRFGLFVHWGVYSEAAGVIRGKRWYGLSEWLMHNSKTPTAEYLELAKRFNPTEFDAKRWVRTVKASGIRYIVITAKHHDGFAMFKSDASPHNIVDATPFKRDPLMELAQAAQAEGIGLGFYYSQNLDWTEPNASGNTWEFDPQKANFEEYFNRKVVPQVTELLTRYGPVQEIWFDMPGQMKPEYSKRLRDLVKKLQPGCLLNSRIGNELGDYASPSDSELVPARLAQGNWEAIYWHNRSWGYSAFDNDYKSTDTLITLLVTTASRGGNFTINMGPDGKGRFPEDAEKRLLGVGRWLKVNGESVYGTQRSPLPQMPWGVATQRPGKLYLHVLNWPRDGVLRVPGLSGKVTAASMLDGGQALEVSQDKDLSITLPSRLPRAADEVIALTIAGALQDQHLDPIAIAMDYRRQTLDVADASLVGENLQLNLAHVKLYAGDANKFYTVTGLNDPTKSIGWDVQVDRPGEYHVDVEYSATGEQSGKEGWVKAGEQRLPFNVIRTGNIENYEPTLLAIQPVGVLSFKQPGVYRISVSPQAAGADLFQLRMLHLTPVN